MGWVCVNRDGYGCDVEVQGKIYLNYTQSVRLGFFNMVDKLIGEENKQIIDGLQSSSWEVKWSGVTNTCKGQRDIETFEYKALITFDHHNTITHLFILSRNIASYCTYNSLFSFHMP